MLKVMRDSFQHLKWILVFVVFVFIVFVFAQWGAGGAGAGGGGNDSYAARVNGETITARDFDRAIYYTEKNYEQLYGQGLTPDMLKALNIPQQVLGSLVERKLLLQEAGRLDLTATPEEVRKRIMEMPVFVENGAFVGPDLYRRYVTANLGFASPAAFESEIREEITLDKLESALSNAVVISPEWAEGEYRRRNENARIEYVLLPVDRVLDQVSITPAEVQAYYNEHARDYQHPEQRKVKYLLADLAQIRSQITVDEARLRQQYEQAKEAFRTGESVRASHILIQVPSDATPEQDATAKAKAESILDQLKKGGDFAALAKENSADPGSAARGGDLGFFEKGQMVPEFESKAFSLQPGQTSDVFKTGYGYHILKVTDKRPAGYKPFEEVRQQLEGRVREEQAREIARERIAQVRARIQQSNSHNDDEFRALTSETVSFNDTGWFDNSGAIAGLGRNPELSNWAFAAKQGDVGEIIQTQRGPLVPVLAGVRPAGIPPLDEIRTEVEADAKAAKARSVASQKLAAAVQGRSLDQVGAELSLSPATATVTRVGAIQGLSGNTEPLVDAALAAKLDEVKGPVVVDQGALVFRVLEQKKFDPAVYATEKDSFIAAMQTNEARKLRKSLLDRLRKKARVETNTKLVESRSTTQPNA